MNSAVVKGALILVCRSGELDNFGWFRNQLLAQLTPKFRDRVTAVDIESTRQLEQALYSPPCHHDVSEVHLLAEFEMEALVISSQDGEYLTPEQLGTRPEQNSLSMAAYLANTTVKIWYWSRANQPGFTTLTKLSQHFGHRFFFLPIAQLKRLEKSKPARTRSVNSDHLATGTSASAGAGFLQSISMTKVIAGIIAVAIFYPFIFDQEVDYTGQYDEVISYQDSYLDIDLITMKLDDPDGELVRHTWVYSRKQWEFEWFVADEWLENANRELEQAANNATGGSNQYWGSIYRTLLRDNADRLDSVATSLQDHGDRFGMDRYELASLALAFVQHIPYKIPSNNLGLMTPPSTLSRRYGDCDTKSLLYVLLMRKLGFDVSLYISSRYRHAMAGVNINASGTYKTHQGTRYYFAESTTPGHRIGYLASSIGQVGSWQIIPLPKS